MFTMLGAGYWFGLKYKDVKEVEVPVQEIPTIQYDPMAFGLRWLLRGKRHYRFRRNRCQFHTRLARIRERKRQSYCYAAGRKNIKIQL